MKIPLFSLVFNSTSSIQRGKVGAQGLGMQERKWPIGLYGYYQNPVWIVSVPSLTVCVQDTHSTFFLFSDLTNPDTWLRAREPEYMEITTRGKRRCLFFSLKHHYSTKWPATWMSPHYAGHSNWWQMWLFHLLYQGSISYLGSPLEAPLTGLSSPGLTRDLKADETPRVRGSMLQMQISLNMNILWSVEQAPRHVCAYASIISPVDKDFIGKWQQLCIYRCLCI